MRRTLIQGIYLVQWGLVIATVLLIFLGVSVAEDGTSTALGRVAAAADPVAEGPTSFMPESGQATDRIAELATKRAAESDDFGSRAISFFGIFGFIGLAWLMSSRRNAVKWRLVAVGTSLQLVFAVFILWTSVGQWIFDSLNDAVMVLLGFTQVGTDFIFGSYALNGAVHESLMNFVFQVLPTIIFFSSLMTVLYYMGVMQWLVSGMSKLMVRFMGTSGSETLSATANIFVGQTEAPLVVKPYVATMTESELMAIMTGGFATVAGGVLAAYVAMLAPYFPDIAGHLIAASVMSAPAALVVAKVMVPETEQSPTMGSVNVEMEKTDANVIDAAARGAGEGLTLAFNVAAMLLAFVALVAMINYLIGVPSRLHNNAGLEGVTNYLHSSAMALPEGCADPNSDADIIRCTHAGLALLAAEHGIPVQQEVLKFGPFDEEDVRIEKTEQLGLLVAAALSSEQAPEHPLEGSAALTACESGRVAACGAVVAVTSADSWVTGLEAPDVWPFLTLEFLLGWLFFPLAWLMGVPWEDCRLVGQLLGKKMVLNEFLAYLDLSALIEQGKLGYRSIIISTYALCGFANFGSIAIQIGGISGIAPSRRADLAKLGVRAMIAGSIAAFMTATIAGALIR